MAAKNKKSRPGLIRNRTDLFGWAGVALVVIPGILLIAGVFQENSLTPHIVKLIGACGIIYYASVHASKPAIILNVFAVGTIITDIYKMYTMMQ